MLLRKTYSVLALAALLAACGNDLKRGAGDSAAGNGDPAGQETAGESSALTREAFFVQNVQPGLDHCRTCHVPGGLADQEKGRNFILSTDRAQDFVNFKGSWERLGAGNNSRILLMASGQEPHTGGSPWPQSGAAYKNGEVIIRCFADPASCASQLGSGTTPSGLLPLLGSSHARSYMDAFCEGQSDTAILPQDPREMVRPGVNAGKNVAFNAYWQDCAGPSNNPLRKPVTCGEYRARKTAGEKLIRTDLAMTFHGSGVVPKDLYNAMWTRWGLTSRPANFDEQVRERYGLPKAPFHNPYPLPGEDPATSNGGSGQLPAGLVQSKDANGRYNGMLSPTCDACHAGELKGLATTTSSGFVSGLGAHSSDLQLLFSDALVPAIPVGLNSTRGVTNAMGLSGFLIGLVDADSLDFNPVGTAAKVVGLQTPTNTTGSGDTKMPAWWNASHRPRKFWDAGYSYDAMRLDSAILLALMPFEGVGAGKKMREVTESHSLDVQAYIESLQAPSYPGSIDTALAEQGAVLFHAKDLWANGANADIPRPVTNGSCAGCHGAYAPRYVNDPSYLDSPRLEGMAGYISPIDQIRTDPARLKGFTRPLLELMSTSWFSYPEGSPGYVRPEQKNALQETADDMGIFTPGARTKGACTWQGALPEDVVGYLAPPLHGIWATAPYLHNGSVPDVWSLLKPAERPAVWRRQLTRGEGGEHGFDTSMAAYDQQRLGWKFTPLSCGTSAYAACETTEPLRPIEDLLIKLQNFPAGFNSLGYQITPPLTRATVETRKVVNTHRFGKGNQGHDFTRSMTDQERRALIEYLKTL